MSGARRVPLEDTTVQSTRTWQPSRHMTEPFLHRPVMAEEVVELFRPVPPGVIVDATVGGGGHARRLLEARPDVRILGLDRDPRGAGRGRRPPGPLRRPGHAGATPASITSDTIMSDLAIDDQSPGSCSTSACPRPSSTSPSGASPTAADAPLDMRMDPDDPWSAADVVNGYQEAELAHVLAAYGDERYARRIAQAIVEARPDRDHGRAGRHRGRRHPRARPPPGRAPGQAHLPGHPHRGQPRARPCCPAPSTRRIERTRPGGRVRRARLPLGRGPHREGPLPPRRHRRLHLPARPALRVRRRGHRAPPASRAP